MELITQIEKNVLKVKTFLEENENANIDLNYKNVSISEIEALEKYFNRKADYLPINQHFHLMAFFDRFNIIVTSVKCICNISYKEIIDETAAKEELNKEKNLQDYHERVNQDKEEQKENLNQNIN